jgi:TonB family protein
VTHRAGGLALLAVLGCASSGSPGPLNTAPPPPSAAADPEPVATAALARLLEADRERLRACYRAELARDPQLEDKMGIVVYVTPAGKVADMHLVQAGPPGDNSPPSPFLSDAMAQCFGVPVMQWVFPPLEGWHGTVQVPWRPPFLVQWTPPPPADQTAQQKERVRAGIRPHNGELQACYEAYLERAPRKRWHVTLRTKFVITAVGSVEDLNIIERTAGDRGLEDCVLAVVRRMTFPGEPGRDKVFVSYPFTFVPAR